VSEIKAAMDLMRKFEANGNQSDKGEAGCTMSAALTLAHLYLAEHPADEDLKIDEAWLRSVGFEHSDGGWYITIASGPNRLYWVGGLVSISRDGHKHVSLCTGINTRGQLLRLCQALGIPHHPRAATETEPATFRQGYPRTPK
jgi:hypothetical protein